MSTNVRGVKRRVKSHHCVICRQHKTEMLKFRKLTGQLYSLCAACAKANPSRRAA